MTIDELKEKLPDELEPWATDYGPALLKMGADGLRAWIQLLAAGKWQEAYAALLAGMSNAELSSEATKLIADWKAQNAKNADAMDLQKSATIAILRVCLTLALAALGF